MSREEHEPRREAREATSGAERGAPVQHPEPATGEARYRFTRGRERPRGVAWFSARSFWGHFRHFIASAIATEDVDSRDWMTPDDPGQLAERVSRLLGGARPGFSVTERLGRDLWIDYLADTGDDVAVSRAVAGLVFSEYELPDPARPGELLRAPRGDVLFFGGDTAYPVATADEIRTRVIVPFNDVLAERDDGRRRVLLGIPGNHDWYDGLDGFGRMFRRHADDRASAGAGTQHGARRTLLGHYAEWAREFVRGGHIDKPGTLDLTGYTAVQSASYFALPIAPGLVAVGVDRQLKRIDTRQVHFFATFLDRFAAVAPWVFLPDPVYAFGAPSPTGMASLASLRLTPRARPHLVVSGDIHHYRREIEGPSLHVTAGGGGAFLHPAPIRQSGLLRCEKEWPNAAQSRALLGQVPFKVALGRSGFLPHFAFAVLLSPVVASSSAAGRATSALAAAVVIAAVLALIGGARRGGAGTVVLALAASAIAPLTCFAARHALDLAVRHTPWTLEPWAFSAIELLAGVVVGAFAFGAYLALLTRFGYENTQAFTALDHPGFKHFVRFRVRADGSAVDGFCIGLADPVHPRERPVLVDAFSWKSR
jgi:hypothetical protein